jgi:hypothetical protein
MKHRSIVEAVVDVLQEVLDAERRGLGVELNVNLAFRGLHDDHRFRFLLFGFLVSVCPARGSEARAGQGGDEDDQQERPNSVAH